MKNKLSKKMRDFIEWVEGYDEDEYYIEPASGIEDDTMLFWMFVSCLVIAAAVCLVPMRGWISWVMQ